MTLPLLILAHAILIGVVAQQYFRRVGVVWALIALAIDLGLWWFFDSAVTSSPKYILDPEYRQTATSGFGALLAMILMTLIPSTVIVWAVLATLPTRADDAGAAPHPRIILPPAPQPGIEPDVAVVPTEQTTSERTALFIGLFLLAFLGSIALIAIFKPL